VKSFPFSLLLFFAGTALLCAFDKTVENRGITFHIRTSGDKLTITPKGLKGDNSPIVLPLHGEVTNVEADDLNNDFSPEVYIYVREPGPEQRGLLIAYSANNRKSLTPISMPDLRDIHGATKNYHGHDEFAVVENTFVRRFPIGGGKYRQIQFKLRKGEATWQLKPDKVLEF
jgi:hypothetical protein